jgi:hypothetical protein
MTNRDELLALARDAGVTIYDGAAIGRRADLLRFADALIERCAVKCDVIDDQYDNGAGYPAQRCANALRAMKVSAP